MSILVVGTNDGHTKDVLTGDHATHYLVKRSYISKQGGTFDGSAPVLPEVYFHHYTDREFVDLAKLRGVFVSCLGSMVEHIHPEAGKTRKDATYRKNNSRIRQDRLLYEQRLHDYTG